MPDLAEKSICCRENPEAANVARCSVKEDMQRPLQIFSCEYCEIFINTYFEKHLWTAASENQDLVKNLPKEGISSWISSSF